MKAANNSWWPWVVGIIVVILLAAVLLWLPVRQNSGAPVYAQTGTLTPGFPSSLLIDSTAKVTESYSITDASGTKQYTATWDSSASPTNIAAGYRLYFQGNGWQIVNQVATSPDFQSIYVVNASGAVNFTATSESGGGSSVTVSFVADPSLASTAITLPYLTTSNGSLNASFPTQFIVDSGAKILSSSDNPDPTAQLHTTSVIYQSTESVSTIFNAYAKIFSGSAWQLAGKTDDPSLSTLEAINSTNGEQVNVQIQPGANGVTIVTASVQMPMKNQ